MGMIKRESREIFICGIKEDNVKNELFCEQYHIELGNEVHLTKYKIESMPKWNNAKKEDVLMGNFYSFNFNFIFNDLCVGTIGPGMSDAKRNVYFLVEEDY